MGIRHDFLQIITVYRLHRDHSYLKYKYEDYPNYPRKKTIENGKSYYGGTLGAIVTGYRTQGNASD